MTILHTTSYEVVVKRYSKFGALTGSVAHMTHSTHTDLDAAKWVMGKLKAQGKAAYIVEVNRRTI